MATIICVDDLKGCPQKAFEPLKIRLEKQGHTVFLVDVSSVEDYKGLICETLKHNSLAWVDAPFSRRRCAEVFLLGYLGGADAVRGAAEVLWEEGDLLSGVILISPRVSFFMAPWKWVTSPRALFAAVLSQKFWSLTIGRYCYSTLHIFGGVDAFASAQHKLGHKLLAMSFTSTHVMRGVGAEVLASGQCDEVCGIVERWIGERAKSRNQLTLEDAYAMVGCTSPHIVDCEPPYRED